MKKILFVIMAMCVCIGAKAQEFEAKTFTSASGSELLYRQLNPVVKAKGGKYPLVLFLHGAGEKGNDNTKQLTHGSKMFQNPVNLEKYPAYVLFPQCPKGTTWAFDEAPDWNTSPFDLPLDNPESTMSKLLMELLDSFIAEHPDVNTKRIYIMGLSMGGIGTYDIVTRHPDRFAAAVPICGCVNPGKLAAAKKVNFSIYHGDNDHTVPYKGSREAYKALKAAGANVRYKEFVACGHGSWEPAFNEPDFMSWLFKQHK